MSLTFNNSFETATAKIMELLCTATGYTENKNAFRYYIAHALPAWGLFLGGGQDVSNTWHDASPTELRMNCELRGQFVTTSQAQEFSMKVLSALPIYHKGNIQVMRLLPGGLPDIGFDTVEVEGKKAVIWEVRIVCDCVFMTGTTYA